MYLLFFNSSQKLQCSLGVFVHGALHAWDQWSLPHQIWSLCCGKNSQIGSREAAAGFFFNEMQLLYLHMGEYVILFL